MVEAIIASGLVTGLITGLVAVVLAWVGHARDDKMQASAQERDDKIRSDAQQREDAIRSNERDLQAQIREEERSHADEDKQRALDTQMRLIRDERENDRIVALNEEGRRVGREILSALSALRDDLDHQPHNIWGYNFNRDLANAVHDVSLLSPDPDLHEFVTRTLNVIEGMQVAVETGEIAEPDVCRAQMRALTGAMSQVGRFAATNAWNRSQLADVRAQNDAVDRGYNAKFENAPLPNDP